jgi:hypothetical protein
MYNVAASEYKEVDLGSDQKSNFNNRSRDMVTDSCAPGMKFGRVTNGRKNYGICLYDDGGINEMKEKLV